MPDTRKLRPLAEAYCPQYKTKAQFFIQDEHPSGFRHLVVQYEKGGYGGDKEFTVAIPAHWAQSDVLDLLLWPMKDSKSPYPAWEFATRAHGANTLYRWWRGEKPS
jgi:hypothetical protein